MATEPDLKEVADNADYAVASVMELESKIGNLSLIGEALAIVRGIVADLIPEADAHEFADDLNRLSQIASLVRY